jgi:type III restriction enzyme
MDLAAVLAEHDYCPYREYRGVYAPFVHHAFDKVGWMNGEEADCAKRIDDHKNVNRWIRNLEHESAGGFSLPLSPGRFFPDFIVELLDGRTAIVEYKNPMLAQDKKEQHKKDVGDLWAARSGGRCVFVWVVDRDWETLKAELAATPTGA